MNFKNTSLASGEDGMKKNHSKQELLLGRNFSNLGETCEGPMRESDYGGGEIVEKKLGDN